jgi:UPF0755 protein
MAKKKRPRERRKREPEASPPSKLARLSAIIVALCVLATAIVFFGWYPSSKGPPGGPPIRFHLSGNESTREIVDLLVSGGAVHDPGLFSVYFRTKGGWAARGDHLMPPDLEPREVVARLQRHGQTTKIVFPEGWTHFEMARRLEKQSVCDINRFNDAVVNKALLEELHLDGESAEGFLFPATYDLPMDSDPEDVVRTMVRAFETRWTRLATEHARGLRDLRDGMGWTRRQIVTLASMVEKEAAKDEERPIVASVFLNRLKDPSFTPKLLQCDPTAAYGCLVSDAPSCMSFSGKVTHELLADAMNPYNTYKHEGLPPGPIANPGTKSIEAALEPAATKYLYFVAKGGGEHTFSETYADHEKAVKGP